MFERFTDRARRVIVVAQDAAREMGHAQIKPEHLLLGLRQGDGMAAEAMNEAGVDGAAMRERVAALYEHRPAATKADKVPFSPEGKKALEQSLRAALALGHNYIGTEHLFFGIQRLAESDNRSLDELLGASAAEISRVMTERLGRMREPFGTTSVAGLPSPALRAALERARTSAGESAMSTRDVLEGILADPDSWVSKALDSLGIDQQQVQAALASVNVAETSDADNPVTLKIGDSTIAITDPEVASALRELGPEELRGLLKDAVDRREPGQAATG